MKESEAMFFESQQEHIPTIEEVRSIFKKITEKERVQPDRILEDEKGVYALEFTVASDTEGEKIEYGYMRKGRHEKGQSSSTSIQATHYDKDGMPYFGETVAECVDGKWRII
jgi:hypothetical protein